MSSFRSFLVIFLVTVLGLCRHTLCAHTFNDSSSEINWRSNSAYQPVNNDRQVRESSSSGSFSSNSANIVNHRNIENSQHQSVAPSPSTVSIVPSYSYQFHTNDHEHLDRIVGSHHQNSFTNSFGSAPSHSGSGSSISNKISNVPGADNELSGSTRVESVSPGHKRDTASHLPNFSNQQQNQAYYSAPAPASELKPSYQYQEQVPKQQEKIASWTLNSQRMEGNWEGKQKQQQQPAQSHQFQLLQQSVPPANPSYLSQKAQHTVTTSTQHQNPNPSWTGRSTLVPGGKKSVIRNNSSSAFVYSHPLKTQQNDNKNPISSQTRHQQPVQYQTSFLLSKANPELATSVPHSTPQTPRSMPSFQQRLSTVKNERKKKTGGKRKILSRADSYSDDEEQYLPDDDDQDDDGNEMMPFDGSDQGDHNEYYYGGQDAQLRDIPGFGGPFVGATGPQFPPGPPVLPPPGAALPPPPPLKGSVDYILIPLILIGLAGPIFVVLYVVLGAFEYRIAPVTRSLKSSFADYQPYLDSVTSSVGRALEKYECLDYATCHFRGYYNGLGLSSNTSSTIESTLSSVTPKEYLPSLRSVFSILKNPEVENCHKYKCSNMLDKIPRSFKNYF